MFLELGNPLDLKDSCQLLSWSFERTKSMFRIVYSSVLLKNHAIYSASNETKEAS